MKKNKRVFKKIKNIGKMTVGVGLTVGSIYGITNLLMDLALNRDLPKIAKKTETLISGKIDDSEFIKVLKEKSIELEHRTTEEIHILADDGILLVGHWIPVENPKRIIIAMHGWRTSWHNDFGMVAEAWSNSNCSVLYAEQRGQNNSGGDYIGFGLIERYDCKAWAEWAREKYGESIPIYLVGVSMGATTVLYASELELPSNVHGIIADCGFTSPEAIMQHVAKDNLHIPYETKKIFVQKAFERKVHYSTNKYTTMDALKKTKIPVLFIHGSDDMFVPVKMTFDNYKACASPKMLLIIPGAGHGMSYFIDQESYQNIVLKFWEEYDK